MLLAQQAAIDRQAAAITTVDLYEGILREEHGLASRVVTDIQKRVPDRDVTSEAKLRGLRMEADVHERLTEGERPSTRPPFTAEAKKVLEYSLREALSLGHNYIGTEHILLSLVKISPTIEGLFLSDEIRSATVRWLTGPQEPQTVQVIKEYAVVPAGAVRLVKAANPFDAAKMVAEQEAAAGDTDSRRSWHVLQPKVAGRRVDTVRAVTHEVQDCGEA